MKSNYKNNKKKIKVTIKNLLANDFHLGEEVHNWHPSMNASVLGSIDVIPLKRTLYSKKKKTGKFDVLENLKKFTKK